MADQRFYVWNDCPECRGTGFYPDAATECDCCRQTYVECLEVMVDAGVALSSVMAYGLSENMLYFARERAEEYRATQNKSATK